MNRGLTMTLATVSASTIGLIVAVPVAHADPAVPQSGAVCNMTAESPAADTGAQTFTPQHDVLMCVRSGDVGVWQPVDGVQRPVRAWFTYGPEATLTGDDVIAGEFWVAKPRTVTSYCTEEQTDAAGAQLDARTNSAGQYYDFPLKPGLATLKLKGECNWMKYLDVGQPPPRA